MSILSDTLNDTLSDTPARAALQGQKTESRKKQQKTNFPAFFFSSLLIDVPAAQNLLCFRSAQNENKRRKIRQPMVGERGEEEEGWRGRREVEHLVNVPTGVKVGGERVSETRDQRVPTNGWTGVEEVEEGKEVEKGEEVE